MNKKLLIYASIAYLCFSGVSAYAQKTSTVNYNAASGLSTAICNVFNTATLNVIGGLTHYPLAGGVTFKTTYIDLQCQNGSTMATSLGTGFAIQYPFKPGHSYTISVTRAKASSDPVSSPYLTLSLFPSLPDQNTTNPGVCGPVGQANWGPATGSIIGANYIADLTQKTVTYAVFVAPAGSANNFLSLVVSQGSSSAITDVEISAITITETVALSVSPNQLNVSCGTALSQTFTVANTNNATGINSYTWNLGAVPNGWLYNGSAAPATITTTTNTLQLTSSACGTLPGNISVTASLTGYNVSAGTITTAFAPYSISGPTTTALCTSGVFSIANLNCPSASVNWSISPSYATLSCTSCAQTTVTKTGNGQATLTASITGGCLTGTTTLTQPLYIGAHELSITGNPQGPCSDNTQTWFCSASPSSYGYNYNWTVTYQGPNTRIYISNTAGSAAWVDVIGGGGQVTLTYTDQCNTQFSETVTVFEACQSLSSAFTLAPNPASNTVTITPKTTQGSSVANSKLSNTTYKPVTDISIDQIRVFDVTGKLKKVFHFGTKNSHTEINVSDLAPGVYFLEIRNNKGIVNEKLIISRS